MSNEFDPRNYSDFAQECFGYRGKTQFIAQKRKADAEMKWITNIAMEALGVTAFCTVVLMSCFKNRSPSGVALRMKMMKENPLYRQKIRTVVATTLVTTVGYLHYCNQMTFADNPYSLGLLGRDK